MFNDISIAHSYMDTTFSTYSAISTIDGININITYMRDRFGEILEEGDKVYFTHYKSSTIYKGVILKFKNNKIYIQGENQSSSMSMRQDFISNRTVKIKC